MVDFLRRFGTVTLEGDTLAVAKACSYNAAFKGQDVTDHVLKCQQLNSWLDGLIVSFMSIGTMFGALAGSYLADFLGRRRAMQWEVLMFLIGVAIQISVRAPFATCPTMNNPKLTLERHDAFVWL